MSDLGDLARRRPALVVTLVLYLTITVLVARSPVTVALCVVLLVSVLVQVGFAVRRARAGRPRPA